MNIIFIYTSIRKDVYFYTFFKEDKLVPAKGQKTGYTFNCENCNIEVYQTKTQYERAKHHFCSNKCQKEYQHKQLFEDRKCEICDNIFHVSKKSSQRFCSIQCQGKWQSTQLGDLNPRSKKQKTNCDFCGKLINVANYKMNKFKHHFCNQECSRGWYSTTFSQDDEWKDISRKRAVNILSNNIPTTNTKPQLIINELLDNLKINYRNEENFVYYSVDNFLYEYGLIIEVMGDFWHCNPQKYSYDTMRDIQKKRIPKDKAKHTYILNNHSVEILYLWETDIYNNIDLCRLLIKKYVEDNGKLENYHSFNYHMQGSELVLNKDIIIPFQDNKTA